MNVSGDVAAGAGVVDKCRLAATPAAAPSFAEYERHLQFLPTAAALVDDAALEEKEELGAGRHRWAIPPPRKERTKTTKRHNYYRYDEETTKAGRDWVAEASRPRVTCVVLFSWGNDSSSFDPKEEVEPGVGVWDGGN